MPVIHEGDYYVEVLEFDIYYLKRVRDGLRKFDNPTLKLEISKNVSELVVECDPSDISKIYDYLHEMMVFDNDS